MRIRLIGACRSGKSYIAKELSREYGVPYYELDNCVWDRSVENRKFPVDARDTMLHDIIHTESWIVEGVHYKWGQESFAKVDWIFVIQSNTYVRDYRVFRRFVRTRLGLEEWNYKQSWKNLYQMLFVWNKGYDKDSMKDIMEMTACYADKRIVVKSNQEIMRFVQNQKEVIS
ncbi:hypothetical protein BVG16_12135 [Paenibacillus selenitireducens]|uniref:DNA topology modulation protein FlaR n=1 Tax=Paenibacillus selenitireducens TaxID=1324314 RepID=A0A1T2XFC7_9BACL|nr:hypothetical protein [Paenibacillus selenitireducens]OPA78607.1 hypothetical protein BVG16_12135 [Paenibacillus selenitireducens]